MALVPVLKYKMKSMETITALPDEVLELIMTYLPLADRKNCRLVCHRWCDVSNSAKLIKNDEYTLSNYSYLNQLNFIEKYSNIKIMKVENNVCNDLLGEFEEEHKRCSGFWLKSGKYVKKLTMFIVDEQTEHLKEIFPNTPNLEYLSLCDCRWGMQFREPTKQKPSEVPSLPHLIFPKLVTLKIKFKRGLTAERFNKLVEKAPQLQHLSLNSFPSDVEGDNDLFTAVEDFTKRQRKILTGLELNFAAITNSHLSKILSNLGPQMTELSLDGCEIISDTCLVIIQKNLPNLKKLNLNSTRCSDRGIKDLLESLKHLTHVYLESTAVAMATATLLKGMAHLNVLSLSSTSRQFFNEQCVRTAFDCEYKHLTELRLCSFEITDELLGDIVPALMNLESLYLDCCPNLTTKAIKHISLWCKKLIILSLQYCYGIEDIYPVWGLPNLKWLHVFDCPISDVVWKHHWSELKNVKVNRSTCIVHGI